MERPKYNEAIISRIKSYEEGTVFIPSDFADIANILAVNMALTRLTEENVIKRVMRGVYEKPRFSNLLKEYVATDTEKVADAIARNHGWSIAPAGDTALNLLRLSTQVPAVWLYVSDGPYREYEYGHVKIKIKHVTNKQTSGMSYITKLTIQAIRVLGKDSIQKKDISKLKSVLTDSDKNIIVVEAKGTIAWVYDIIRDVCD
ncbi:MAG: DUF6088 family protein [Lachnotalea sp.]